VLKGGNLHKRMLHKGANLVNRKCIIGRYLGHKKLVRGVEFECILLKRANLHKRRLHKGANLLNKKYISGR